MSAHQSPTESGGQPPSECNSASANASADDPDVFRLGSLLALRNVELDLLPFVDAAVATTRDRAEVHEHVRATLDLDEAVALVAVKPLHSALRHLDLLRCGRGAPGHGGQRAATIRARLSGKRSGCKPYGQTRTAAPPSSETTAANTGHPQARPGEIRASECQVGVANTTMLCE